MSIPHIYLPFILYTLTQLVCVAGVHRLTSALTVTLVLVIRKAISLIISIIGMHVGRTIRGFVSLTSATFVVSLDWTIDPVELVWTRLGCRGQVVWRSFELKRAWGEAAAGGGYAWPEEGIVDLLVQRSSGQCIYAAKVLKFVGADFCSPMK